MPDLKPEHKRTILKRSVGSGTSQFPERHLRLMMLSCEENHPYGPSDHTGAMFLSLICRALEEIPDKCDWIVEIALYHAQLMDYPRSNEEWDSYDGILLPGSLSGAYEKKEWIEQLCAVITKEIHGKGRKTFGVCFGHQVYAHSFDDGQATKCAAGLQTGRRIISLTSNGSKVFPKSCSLELLFTHGDMVQRLPPCALCLAETEAVPVQAAAYFRSPEEKDQFLSSEDESSHVFPIAITFQAHPEYADQELGLKNTLTPILEKFVKGGILTTEEAQAAQKDVSDQYDTVEKHSLKVMKVVGRIFGWF